MPKMKTHSSLKRRVKVTGTGKIVRYSAYRNHMLEHKSTSGKRQMRKSRLMAAGDVKRLSRMLGSIR